MTQWVVALRTRWRPQEHRRRQVRPQLDAEAAEVFMGGSSRRITTYDPRAFASSDPVISDETLDAIISAADAPLSGEEREIVRQQLSKLFGWYRIFSLTRQSPARWEIEEHIGFFKAKAGGLMEGDGSPKEPCRRLVAQGHILEGPRPANSASFGTCGGQVGPRTRTRACPAATVGRSLPPLRGFWPNQPLRQRARPRRRQIAGDAHYLG